MKEFPIANEFGLALALVGMFLALLSLMAILVVCLTCGDIFYIVYALLVFLMVVAEITLCILFLNSNSVLHKNIKEDLKEKVRNEYVDQGNDTFSETLNLIHIYGCYTKLMEEIQKNLAWITTILLLLILLQSGHSIIGKNRWVDTVLKNRWVDTVLKNRWVDTVLKNRWVDTVLKNR
uniref:Tetraspanin n=1 Tax=Biomphalaria glabrata TaxID=6526 RepID=A0A2C9M6K9_BIOGL